MRLQNNSKNNESVATKNLRSFFSSKNSILFITLLFSFDIYAGAWVPNIGSGYSKIGVSHYQASDYFGSNTDAIDFSGQNYSFYGEYGIAKNIALYGTFLYQTLDQTNNAGITSDSSGFGDSELGVKYQWQAQPFVISTALLAKIPYFYDKNEQLPRGNGKEDFEFRILLGRSLNTFGYLGLEAAYRIKTGFSANEFRYLLEYGFSVSDHLYLRSKVDTTMSTNENSDNTNNLAISSGFDLTKIEMTAGWLFGNVKSSSVKWGIEATYRRDLAGKNALKGNGIDIGIASIF